MTNDKPTPPNPIADLIQAISESLRSTPTRQGGSVGDRILDIVNNLAATVQAAETPIPDDLRDVWDDPRQSETAEDEAKRTQQRTTLPTLRAGIYKHHKGLYYNVLGYALDANDMNRTVVVYVPLYAGKRGTGPHMFVRSVGDFFSRVNGRERFTYIGPEVV